MSQLSYALGIDIGGTKIATALIDHKGKIAQTAKVASDVRDAEKMFQSVITSIETVLLLANLELKDVAAIGVGLPGKVDHLKGIAVFQNNLPWANFPVVQRLREWGDLQVPIAIDNDVKVAAFAEYQLADIKADDTMSYLTISTGIALTSMYRNEALRGVGFSGEIGFLPVASLEEEESAINLEQYASGPGIEKRGQLAFGNPELTTEDIFNLYREEDATAVKLIEESAAATAQALFAVTCVLDPALFVLGGSVAFHNPTYVEAIKHALGNLLHAEQRHILDNIKVTQLGGDNGVIGAGLLAWHQV